MEFIVSLLAGFGLNLALKLTTQHQSNEINRRRMNYSRKYSISNFSMVTKWL